MNILDQIFNTITAAGVLRPDVFVSSLGKLHPMADKIISRSFQSRGLVFSLEDFYILSSEISKASKETLVEMCKISITDNCDGLLDYIDIFYPFAELRMNGEVECIFWARSWSAFYYEQGRLDLVNASWLIEAKKWDEITKDIIDDCYIIFSNPECKDFVRWAEKNRPDLGIVEIKNSKGERVITTDTNARYWDTLSAIHHRTIPEKAINHFVRNYPILPSAAKEGAGGIVYLQVGGNNSGVEKRLERIESALLGLPQTQVTVGANASGIFKITKNRLNRAERIRKISDR